MMSERDYVTDDEDDAMVSVERASKKHHKSQPKLNFSEIYKL